MSGWDKGGGGWGRGGSRGGRAHAKGEVAMCVTIAADSEVETRVRDRKYAGDSDRKRDLGSVGLLHTSRLKVKPEAERNVYSPPATPPGTPFMCRDSKCAMCTSTLQPTKAKGSMMGYAGCEEQVSAGRCAGSTCTLVPPHSYIHDSKKVKDICQTTSRQLGIDGLGAEEGHSETMGKEEG